MYYNGNIYTAGMSYDPHDFTAVTGDEWLCLDAATGNIKWIWEIPLTINGIPQKYPIYAGNYLYVIPSQPTVYKDTLWIKINGGYALLNPDTGAVLSYLTNGDGCSFPAFDGDYHYGIANGSAYCLDVNTLTVKWTSAPLRLGGSHITISGGFLYVSTPDGNITRLSQTDGVLVWEFPWTARTSELPTSAIMTYGPPPCVAYARVLFGTVEGAIYSVDCAVDNTAQWKFQTGGAIYAQSAVADGKFYTGSSDGRVYCLTTTGDLVWQYDTGYQISGSPAIADGKLFVVGDNKYMYCFGPGPASTVTLAALTSITVGQSLTMTGKFVDEAGVGIAGDTVTLSYRLAPMESKDITTVTTASDGSFSYTWTPPFDGYYDVTASYQEPAIGGYSSSSTTSTVRVAPTAPEVTVDLTPVTDAINSLQTFLLAIAVLVIVAIAVSAIAVIYSRRKSK
jgi:outer membrane protein assembly factor BamB